MLAHHVSNCLDNIIASVEDKEARLVVYLIIPSDLAWANVTDYVHILKALRAAPHVVHQFVPITLLNAKIWTERKVGAFVTSTYDQCVLRVTRTIYRREFDDPSEDLTWIDGPAFTISQSSPPQFRYSLDWGLQGGDLTNRHVFLHVGYTYSNCRRWVFTTYIDQRGERHKLCTQKVDDLDGDGTRDDRVVQFIWKLATSFTQQVNTEWAVVFCKLGRLTYAELKGKVEAY